MPFKEAVIPHLDEIEGAAETIGAVNSVVNERGRLTGYNTDWVGARISLERIEAHPGERVLLLGAGGVARAILYALRDLGFNSVRVASRDPDKVENLLPILKCQHVAWEQRGEEKPEVLINATPVGMSPEASRMPVDDGVIRACRGVLDVVVSPMETELIRRARSAGKSAVPGYLMSLHQAAAQFRLYTGVEPPMDVLQHSLEGLLQA
jgi:shikimate dehydrogenase